MVLPFHRCVLATVVIFILINAGLTPAVATKSEPCTPGTPVCSSCTCFDSSEYENSEGGVFFFETFDKASHYPQEWLSNNDNTAIHWFIRAAALYSVGGPNNWFISPVISTDAAGLQDLRLDFAVGTHPESADYFHISILEHTNETDTFFSGEYLDNEITTTGTSRKRRHKNCHSKLCTRNAEPENQFQDVVDAFINYGSGSNVEDGYHDLDLVGFIGQKIRIGINYVGPQGLIDNLALRYQISANEQEPLTDDFTASTPCCGGNSDIDVFVPGETWGGYSKDCNGNQLNAIDFYIYDVDVPNKSVRGRSSVLLSNNRFDCYGSWNNTLNFNASTNAWEFGEGIRISSENSTCNDRISFGKGILCLGGERPSLCGKKSNGVCDLTFSLRRSERPSEQYVYVASPNPDMKTLDIIPINGTLENRYASFVASGGQSVQGVYYYALDDFGRVHAFGYIYEMGLDTATFRTLPPFEPFILSHLLGKDIVGINTGASSTFLWTRSGSVYSHGGGWNSLGQGNIGFSYFRLSMFLKFLPPVDRIWTGSTASIVRTRSGEIWGFGNNQASELGFVFSSVAPYIFYPSPSRSFTDVSKDTSPPPSFALGSQHSVMVRNDRKLYVSGYNSQSELGLRSIKPIHEATLHTLIDAVLNCGCGSYHTYCISETGTLIGFGTAVVAASSEPVEFAQIPGVVTSVKARTLVNAALSNDGRLYYWGVIPTLENTVLEPVLIEFSVDTPIKTFQPGYHSIIMVKDNSIGVKYPTSNIQFSESDGLIEIPVERLNSDIDETLNIYVFARVSGISNSRASSRRDLDSETFVLQTNILQWNAGESGIKNVMLEILDDTRYVLQKRIRIDLHREGVTSSLATEIQVNDDGDAGELCILQPYLTVREDQGTISIRLNRTERSSNQVYAVLNHLGGGSATNQVDLVSGDGDFVFYRSSVTWLSGDNTDKVLTIPINNNDIFEENENFTLEIQPFEGASIPPDCRFVTVFIEDDQDGGNINMETIKQSDIEVVIAITRTNGDSGATSVRLEALTPDELPTGNTAAEKGVDYTFDPMLIHFEDRESETKLAIISFTEGVTGSRVINMRMTKINGTGVLENNGDAIDLSVTIGDGTSGISSSTVSGAVVGVLGASGAIGGLLFYRTRQTHKERLRSQWLIPFEDLNDVDHSEGRMSFTAVYIGSVVFLENLDPQICQQDEETFSKYVLLHHSNLVTYVGVCFAPPLLVTEYCSKGGLDEALEDGKIPFNTNFKASLCSDAAQGMAYLHAKDIVHGMLDLSKLVVNSRFVCKITGVALQSWNLRYASCDMVCWLAPEQLEILGPQTNDEPSSATNIPSLMEKSDIDVQLCDLYSFGTIMFSIFTETAFPYTEEVHMDSEACFKREALRINVITNNVRPEMPSNLTDPIDGVWKRDSHEMKTMEQVQRCWASEPIMRPPFQELVSFFQTMLPSHGKLVETMHEKYTAHMEELVSDRTNELQLEKEETENILSKIHTLVRNILPEHIVDRLQSGDGNIVANRYDEVTVFYSEIAQFTEFASKTDINNIIHLLNGIFSRMDVLASNYHVERVKTFSDAYLAACGAPTKNPNHIQQVLLFALAVIDESFHLISGEECHLRIGIDTGSISAGIVGSRRISYDIWGSTVSKAIAISNNGIEGKVCVSQTVQNFLSDQKQFVFAAGPSVDEQITGGTVHVVMPLHETERDNITQKLNGSRLSTNLSVHRVNMSRGDKMNAVKNMLKLTSIGTPGDLSSAVISIKSGGSSIHLATQREASLSGVLNQLPSRHGGVNRVRVHRFRRTSVSKDHLAASISTQNIVHHNYHHTEDLEEV